MSPARTSEPVERRCQPRTRQPGDLRPTDVIGAYFVAALAFLVAGLATAILNTGLDLHYGRWLALHLLFVGGISQLIFGASQFFVGAYLATGPPPRRLVRLEIASWNLGAVALAVAVPGSSTGLASAAVGLLLASLTLYGAALLGMRRRSLREAPWATRWYLGAATFFAVGIVAGRGLGSGLAWPHGDLLATHISLNLAGWFGAAIVGTLHTFFPSLTQTELRFPALQGPTWLAWLTGVAALAVGYGWSAEGVSSAGWLMLLAAAVLLVINVGAATLRAPRPLSLPARIVGLGQGLLLIGLLAATLTALSDGPGQALGGSNRAVIATLLVLGWIGLTVLGSLLHLLAVVVRVRDFSRSMAAPRVGYDRAVATIAATGVIGLALAQRVDLGPIAPLSVTAVLFAYGLLGGRILGLGLQVVRYARPRLAADG